MRALFEIPNLNIYIQLAVTVVSIAVHLFNQRNRKQKEKAIKIIAIYTIGLSGWFGIMSGLFGHIIYANEVAANFGWPYPLKTSSDRKLG